MKKSVYQSALVLHLNKKVGGKKKTGKERLNFSLKIWKAPERDWEATQATTNILIKLLQ